MATRRCWSEPNKGYHVHRCPAFLIKRKSEARVHDWQKSHENYWSGGSDGHRFTEAPFARKGGNSCSPDNQQAIWCLSTANRRRDINPGNWQARRQAETLSLVERHLPLTMQVLSFHLLHPICVSLRIYGAIHSMWMAYIERYNNYLCSLIQNRRYPEQSIASIYELIDFSTYVITTKDTTGDMVYDAVLELDGEMRTNKFWVWLIHLFSKMFSKKRKKEKVK